MPRLVSSLRVSLHRKRRRCRLDRVRVAAAGLLGGLGASTLARPRGRVLASTRRFAFCRLFLAPAASVCPADCVRERRPAARVALGGPQHLRRLRPRRDSFFGRSISNWNSTGIAVQRRKVAVPHARRIEDPLGAGRTRPSGLSKAMNRSRSPACGDGWNPLQRER